MVNVRSPLWIYTTITIFIVAWCITARSTSPSGKTARMKRWYESGNSVANYRENLVGRLKQRSLLSFTNTTGKPLLRATAQTGAASEPYIEHTTPSTRGVRTNVTIPPLILVSMAIKEIRVDIRSPSLATQSPNCKPEPYSCVNRCSNTTTFMHHSVFNTAKELEHRCYCDWACDETFMDCCSDFAKVCAVLSGRNDQPGKPKSRWRCATNVNVSITGCGIMPAAWMISRCPVHWKNNDVRRKCHGATPELNYTSYEMFVPVVGFTTQHTYRNKYCARCNNVSQYEFWTLNFNKEAVPPPLNTLKQLEMFLSENAPYFIGVTPRDGQRIRWCHYPDVVKTCINASHNASNACVNGPVGLVQTSTNQAVPEVYRNKECALCNNVKATCGVKKTYVDSCSIDFSSISRAITLRDFLASEETNCQGDHVYDPYAKKCRQKYTWVDMSAGPADEYQVELFFLKMTRNDYRFGNMILIQEYVAQYFKIDQIQMDIKGVTNKVGEYILTFTLSLTLSQSLIVASDPQLLGTSNETIGLRRLFKFHKAFVLPGVGLTVYKINIRQVSCTRRHVYRFGEYSIFADDLSLLVNSTGLIYQQHEYIINVTEPNPSVAVCLKLPLLSCSGSFISLNSTEYQISSNLTLNYHSFTYSFGEYQYRNSTVFICVPFGARHIDLNSKKDDLALVVITWLGFALSILSLLALLVTYFIFRELRTLPGKNLMNLAASLCFAEIFWLCRSFVGENKTACTVVAIADHYFFITFFVASSIVAFHSCLVFGKKINLRRSNSEENKTFLAYSCIVWGIPASFVLLFSLLDYKELFDVGYGRNGACWLTTKQSKIFLFILPFGILVLFNVVLFAFVAVRLRENQKSTSSALQESSVAHARQRQNIVICIKLSTLMGFSWLFGLLHLTLETKTDVFLYLFVIFVSFQGLFICAAFLIKRTTFVLYASLISKTNTSQAATGPSRRGDVLHNNQIETKV